MPRPSQSNETAASLIARDLDVLWHPCAQMSDYATFAPLHVVGAKGCRIQLADGRELLDAISSWWCKALGHGHPRLTAALKEQADAFEHVILANTTNEGVVRLCERLLAAANGLPIEHWGPGATPGRQPGYYGKVFLADNGSTGVEIALKMALHAHANQGRASRTHFAALAGGYHGETAGALAVGDIDWATSPYRPMLFDVTKVTGLPCRTGPDDPRWQDATDEWPTIQAQLDKVADTLAAIIYEPVLQGAGGMLLYSPDLLRRLRDWADAHDVYLIADEIAAGFGRLGAMLATHWAMCDVRSSMCDVSSGDAPHRTSKIAHRTSNIHLPHFAVVSKGLTGGYLPLSAVLTTDAIYDQFLGAYGDGRALMHSNTYTGNALAVAVANAVFDVFADEDVLGRVARNGPTMTAALRSLAVDRPYLHGVRGCGMFAAVDIRQPDGSPLDARRRTGYRVYQEAVRRGALLRPLADTMYLFPPLNTEPADIDAMASVLADSLDEVMG